MNNEMSPYFLLIKEKEQRKPTKKEIMKKVFIVSTKQIHPKGDIIKPNKTKGNK
jgi:hypothetical protein